MKRVLMLVYYLLSRISRPLANLLHTIANWKSSLAARIPGKDVPITIGGNLTRLREDNAPINEEDSSKERERFATLTDEVALGRFEQFRRNDPLRDIPPALLNSADISDYVAATGMLNPFYPGKLKPASYEIAFLGKCVYWDEQEKKQVRIISRGEEFVLRKNSIAFVTLEPMFLLPDYIALRFNLKITHIYRGLLLGTGPLIDPGFTGKMSVPLHNLTNNDYTLVGGEDLIWMEFTKISDHKRWCGTGPFATQEGLYHPFPADKSLRDVEFYLRKADPHRPIRSSIPEVVKQATMQAQEARDTVRFVAGLSILGVLAIGTTMISYFSSNTSYLRESQEKLQNMNSQLQEMKHSNHSQQDLDELKTHLKEIDAKISNQNNSNGK